MRERERVQLPLPQGTLDRILLGAGAAALLAVIPMVWMWLLYGSGLHASGIYAVGIGLAAVTVAIGAAMIRILDGDR
jgi:hypothetical protein